MRKPVIVEHRFAEKPAPPRTVKLKNGQVLPVGKHEFRPEGLPTKKIYCYGCKRYYRTWALILWIHGLAKQKPKEVK